jgi:hypothetical protein
VSVRVTPNPIFIRSLCLDKIVHMNVHEMSQVAQSLQTVSNELLEPLRAVQAMRDELRAAQAVRDEIRATQALAAQAMKYQLTSVRDELRAAQAVRDEIRATQALAAQAIEVPAINSAVLQAVETAQTFESVLAIETFRARQRILSDMKTLRVPDYGDPRQEGFFPDDQYKKPEWKRGDWIEPAILYGQYLFLQYHNDYVPDSVLEGIKKSVFWIVAFRSFLWLYENVPHID